MKKTILALSVIIATLSSCGSTSQEEKDIQSLMLMLKNASEMKKVRVDTMFNYKKHHFIYLSNGTFQTVNEEVYRSLKVGDSLYN